MKKNIHPKYQKVVFLDTQANVSFLTRSTIETDEKIKWEDGEEYPLVKVEISAASHPYYTGKKIFVDTAGRVDKFKKRYAKLATLTKGAKKATKEKGEASKKESIKAEAPKEASKKKTTSTKEEVKKEVAEKATKA